MSLTAPERETVITASDADDYVRIWTAQRPVITKLKANPAAILIAEGHHGTSAWAEFHLPAGLLTFRSGRRRMSEAQREAAAVRMRKMRAERLA
jgi:hypothetical protein